MIIRKKEDNKNFTKLTQKGISLIVLIITIIVIIILSTVVIVTISNNNPIDEANTARYESDRDNMQSLFTNTVSKIMVKNQGTVSVTAGQINTVTSGVKKTTGEVSYTVEGAVNVENASGKIVFDKGENTDTTFYTGKQLPIYAAGKTKWYVDSDGIISLRVGEEIHGSGEVPLLAGAYDANGVMLASWNTLVNDYGLDVQSDYTGSTYNTSASSMYSVLNNNEELSATTKIIIDDITNIGEYAFFGCSGLTSITIPDSVTSIGKGAFQSCIELTNVTIPDSVTSIESFTFLSCLKLTDITIGNSVKSIGYIAFYECSGLTSIGPVGSGASLEIPSSVTNIDIYAFQNCRNLQSATIPDSVTSIGDNAFNNCTNLKTIYYKGTATGAPWGAPSATVDSNF